MGVSMEAATLQLKKCGPPRINHNVIELRGNEVSIGRSIRSTHSIHNGFLSKMHAVLKSKSREVWTLEDMNSSNGTFINETKLTANVPVHLHVGDEVGFGMPVGCRSRDDAMVYRVCRSENAEHAARCDRVPEQLPVLCNVMQQQVMLADEAAPNTSTSTSAVIQPNHIEGARRQIPIRDLVIRLKRCDDVDSELSHLKRSARDSVWRVAESEESDYEIRAPKYKRIMVFDDSDTDCSDGPSSPRRGPIKRKMKVTSPNRKKHCEEEEEEDNDVPVIDLCSDEDDGEPSSSNNFGGYSQKDMVITISDSEDEVVPANYTECVKKEVKTEPDDLEELDDEWSHEWCKEPKEEMYRMDEMGTDNVEKMVAALHGSHDEPVTPESTDSEPRAGPSGMARVVADETSDSDDEETTDFFPVLSQDFSDSDEMSDEPPEVPEKTCIGQNVASVPSAREPLHSKMTSLPMDRLKTSTKTPGTVLLTRAQPMHVGRRSGLTKQLAQLKVTSSGPTAKVSKKMVVTKTPASPTGKSTLIKKVKLMTDGRLRVPGGGSDKPMNGSDSLKRNDQNVPKRRSSVDEQERPRPMERTAIAVRGTDEKRGHKVKQPERSSRSARLTEDLVRSHALPTQSVPKKNPPSKPPSSTVSLNNGSPNLAASMVTSTTVTSTTAASMVTSTTAAPSSFVPKDSTTIADSRKRFLMSDSLISAALESRNVPIDISNDGVSSKGQQSIGRHVTFANDAHVHSIPGREQPPQQIRRAHVPGSLVAAHPLPPLLPRPPLLPLPPSLPREQPPNQNHQPSISQRRNSNPEGRQELPQPPPQHQQHFPQIPNRLNPRPARPRTDNINTVLRDVLSWKAIWFEEQKTNPNLPPILNPRDLLSTKLEYGTADEYTRTYRPLIVLETWQQLTSCIFPRRVYFQMILLDVSSPLTHDNRTVLMNFHAVVPDYMEHSDDFPHAGWLVMLNIPLHSNGSNKKNSVDKLAYIECTQKMPYAQFRESETPSVLLEHLAGNQSRNKLLLNITLKTKLSPMDLRKDAIFKMTLITKFQKYVHPFEALANIANNPLGQTLISPRRMLCTLPEMDPDFRITTGQGLIKYNQEQREAIVRVTKACLTKPTTPTVALIYGPPGTGKTSVIRGIISELINGANVTDETRPLVLLCAPSNNAIDENIRCLMERRGLKIVRLGEVDDNTDENFRHIYVEALVKRNIIINLRKEIARLGTIVEDDRQRWSLTPGQPRHHLEKHEKDIAYLQSKLQSYLDNTKKPSSLECDKVRESIILKAQVIATTPASCYHAGMETLQRRRNKPIICIVDEATQCTEPDLLMLLRYNITKLVLVGDPHQLLASVRSQKARDLGYQVSMFERFYKKFNVIDGTVISLKVQYRMPAEICRFPSIYYYGGKLTADKELARMFANSRLAPYTVFDIRDSLEVTLAGDLSNPNEATFIVRLVEVILETNSTSDIGIATYYKAQRNLLRRAINESDKIKQMNWIGLIEINTVDSFQGREKDIVIVSTVRTQSVRGIAGRMADGNLMNVAITRARSALFVCGHRTSLQVHENWDSLMKEADRRRQLFALSSEASESNIGDILHRDRA